MKAGRRPAILNFVLKIVIDLPLSLLTWDIGAGE